METEIKKRKRGNKLDISKDDFELKLIELYGDKYTLESEYIDHLHDVDIYCHDKDFLGNDHGIFKARPIDLIKKTLGCPRCGGTKKSNTEEWKKKADYVHNGYFIYDENTVYTGANKDIIVKCPHHGYIHVKASNHLNGANCYQCYKEGITHKITPLPKVNASTRKLTSEYFFKRLKEIHGDKYDTSKAVFKDVKTKVTLICHEKDEDGNEHGEFSTTPLKLFLGRGCRKCAKNFPRDNELFIKDSIRVHGEDAFIYDEVEYKGNHVKVWLTCKKCGRRFAVEPANHITFRQGCPSCATSKMEKDIAQLLTENNIKYEEQYSKGLDGLRADFYLPEYNIAIECQGMQHFMPVRFGGNPSDEELEKIFQTQIERDDKKNRLLTEQGIDLLYFTNCDISEYRYPLIKDMNVLLSVIKGK